MLRLQRLLDTFVQLFVTAGRFGCVKIAPSDDMAVGRLEVESTGDVFKVAQWQILECASVS